MTKKTPNAQRRTPNIEWTMDGIRISELPNSNYGARRNGRHYDLEDRLLDFAVSVVELTESFPSTRAGNHVAGQLLRCGTSPLSNHGEAQASESRNDFIHKFSICLKELKESRRWFRLAKRVPLIKAPTEFDPLLEETEALIKIFATSIRTAQRNANDSSLTNNSPVRARNSGRSLNVER